MNRVVAEHKGIMYSLQPYGLKSKLVTISAVFVAAFGGALLTASPAQAAPGDILQFSAKALDVPDDTISGGTTPWARSDLNILVTVAENVDGTRDIRLDITGNWLANGRAGVGGPITGFLFYDNKPVTLKPIIDQNIVETFTAQLVKQSPSAIGGWVARNLVDSGDPGLSDWGYTYTQTCGGTVLSTFSESPLTPLVGAYKDYAPTLPACVVVPSPSPSPVFVPQPAKTIIVTKKPAAPVAAPVVQAAPGKTCAQIGHRVYRGDPDYASGPGKPDADSDGVGCESYPDLKLVATPTPTPSPSPSTIVSPSPEATISNLTPVSVDSSGGGSSLAGWGIAVAGAGGLALLGLGLAGVLKRRRYQASHAPGVGDNSQTQVIPVASADDHSVSDYNPNVDRHDPALGGYAGESNQYSGETEILPPASDTKASPPVE